MKALNTNTIAFLTTFSAISSFAQSSELPLVSELAASPEQGYPLITTVVYRNAANNSMWLEERPVDQVSSLRDAARDWLRATTIRTNALSLSIPRTGVITANDSASFTVYAPMKTVNGALSLAGYVSESRVDDSVVRLVQVLSLIAKRQINTELKYSVKLDSHSNFDSALSYRLDPGADSGSSGVAVSMRYSIKF